MRDKVSEIELTAADSRAISAVTSTKKAPGTNSGACMLRDAGGFVGGPADEVSGPTETGGGLSEEVD